MFRRLYSITRDNRAATAIEYALIASLISVAAMTGYQALGDKVLSGFTNVDQELGNSI